MNCEEAKIKVQALIDNELTEEEIELTLSHIESCYKCRNLYKEMLVLKKTLQSVNFPEPPREWFEKLEKRVARKVAVWIGKTAFFSSYLLLLIYAVYSLIDSGETNPLVKIAVLGIGGGLLILLGVSIADRIKEGKTDRYKEVVK